MSIKYTASDLDRRVTLLFETTVRTATGAARPSAATQVAGVPAAFRPVGGSEQIRSGEITATFDARFIMRWRRDLKPQDQILFDGVTYDVISMPIEIGRRDFIEVLAKARHV